MSMQPDAPALAWAEGTAQRLPSLESIFAQRPYIQGIVVGAMMFRHQVDDSSGSSVQTLILRRVATDTFPLKWELPGGGADLSKDRSLVDVAVRELWEETGLRAKRIVCPVVTSATEQQKNENAIGLSSTKPSHTDIVSIFKDEENTNWAVATFIVEVEDCSRAVIIDPGEHIEWAWVSEQQARDGAFSKGESESKKELVFVSEPMKRTILQGFRLQASGQMKAPGSDIQQPQ